MLARLALILSLLALSGVAAAKGWIGAGTATTLAGAIAILILSLLALSGCAAVQCLSNTNACGLN